MATRTGKQPVGNFPNYSFETTSFKISLLFYEGDKIEIAKILFNLLGYVHDIRTFIGEEIIENVSVLEQEAWGRVRYLEPFGQVLRPPQKPRPVLVQKWKYHFVGVNHSHIFVLIHVPKIQK